MNLTVSHKGLILVLLPLVFQIAFVLVLVRFQRDIVAAERMATHTKNVITLAHEIQSGVADGHAAIHGYAIARDPSFVVAMRLAGQELPTLLDDLDRLVSDNLSQTTRARNMRSAIYSILDWQVDIEKRVRAGETETAAGQIRSGRGQLLIRNFQQEIGDFLSEEDRLEALRAAELERSRDRLSVLFVTGGIAAVVCSLALAYVFHRGIARRFAQLEDHAGRLANGELLPPPIEGTDEIARLERAFRDMAAKLIESSDRVRDLYDHAPCGYHSVDPSGTILAINRTELQWLGYEVGEVIGKMRFVDVVSPPSRETYRNTFERVKASGAAGDVELELVRRNGTTFPILLNSSAVRDSAGTYLRSRTTLTDLTERKRAEMAVRLFADVARSIPIGLLIYQLDSADDSAALRVRSGNPFATQLLGVSLDQCAGRAVVDVFPAIPADQLRRYTAVASTGKPDDLGEFQYGDARVAERWWAVQAFPLPERSVGVAFMDISDRKRAEAEVRRLNEELEERVRGRTAELDLANRELVHKNSENEMFVYSVSHDLRSPLVNLQGFSKELEKGCGQLAAALVGDSIPTDVRDRVRTLLDGKMAKSIGFIQSAVLRLGGIIDALLRLSRAGRVEYRWEAIDVNRVVAQVVGAAQGTIAERGATVKVGDLPGIAGDRTAIEQVFANLLGNALTYLDPAKPGEIEIGSLTDDDGYRTYFVRDNGLGIAEGHRQKIFQAFQRAHPGVGTGEGLGLAIVSRVTDRHRGRVWVESRPGEGSVFFVSLPVSAEHGTGR